MTDLVHPSCAIDVCSTRASYGTRGTKTPTHCATHGKPLGLVDVANPPCTFDGCYTKPTYGVLGTTKRTHCAVHGKPLGLVDVKNPPCASEGCATQPSYGVRGTKTATHCATHGKPLGLIGVKNPSCTSEGCTTQPSYGVRGTKTATHCAAHGKPLGLVGVTHPPCASEGCDTIPSYGVRGTKTATHCAPHGKPLGLVDVVNPRCEFEGCDTIPSYGVRGTNTATHCAPHGKQLGLVDVRSPKCEGRYGNGCPHDACARYGPHCVNCTPDTTRDRIRKKTETRCFAVIKRLLRGLVAWREQLYVDFRYATDPEKTRAFIDAELSHPDVRVLLEIDECRHSNPSHARTCHATRMRCVEEVLRREDPRYIAWVRFNPDDGDARASATDQKRRCHDAVAVIRSLIESPRNCVEYVNYE